MALNKDGSSGGPSTDNFPRLVTSAEDKAKAGKWFTRARELGDKRQFDYAVEYYVNGLEFWPDAVEEACKPLYGCAVARKQTGGKKPGLKDTMKRSMTDKDPRQAFVNAMWLFGHDPDNASYIEGVVRAAIRLGAEDAAKWSASILLKALESAAKPNGKHFHALAELLDELGDRAVARSDSPAAVAAFQMGVDVVNVWRRRVAKDPAIENALKTLSTKLTIHKGKYQNSESFRDSMADKEEQRDRHDEQRSVQLDSRMDELVTKAEREFQQDPTDAAKLKNYVDMLCRRERDAEELRAISVLVAEYKRSQNYRWKQLADDIRIKQLWRKERELRTAGDEAALREHQVSILRVELNVYKERMERYPTDLRIKYEYGVRNFKAGRFDEAIPLLQSARSDPKNRIACGMYLGRCFFKKGYYSQAVAELEDSIKAHDVGDDDLAKSMLYWLGRAQEEAAEANGARKTYGRILQVDYNYRDVRARLDALPAG